MSRRWIYIGGQAYEVGVDALPEVVAPTVIGDNHRFVSPIDGSVVDGRAAMREHCARHNVIPNQELAGLKPRVYGQGVTVSQQERDARKRTMHQILDQRYHNQLKG